MRRSGSVQEGIPLRLVLHVYDVDDNDADGSCIPLSGAQVDIWHANSQVSIQVYRMLALQERSSFEDNN
jgi:protocatechuate 3,4-dioxygenase beta subunit